MKLITVRRILTGSLQ